MTPIANIVVLWGGGLLIANVLFDPIFQPVRTAVTSGKAGVADLNTSPVHMLLVGLLTLLVCGFIANVNPRVGKAILAVFFGLTILWLISYNNEKKGTK